MCWCQLLPLYLNHLSMHLKVQYMSVLEVWLFWWLQCSLKNPRSMLTTTCCWATYANDSTGIFLASIGILSFRASDTTRVNRWTTAPVFYQSRVLLKIFWIVHDTDRQNRLINDKSTKLNARFISLLSNLYERADVAVNWTILPQNVVTAHGCVTKNNNKTIT